MNDLTDAPLRGENEMTTQGEQGTKSEGVDTDVILACQ